MNSKLLVETVKSFTNMGSLHRFNRLGSSVTNQSMNVFIEPLFIEPDDKQIKHTWNVILECSKSEENGLLIFNETHQFS